MRGNVARKESRFTLRLECLLGSLLHDLPVLLVLHRKTVNLSLDLPRDGCLFCEAEDLALVVYLPNAPL